MAYPGMRLPEWIPYTKKEWRILKRRQWKAVESAFDNFYDGAAYTPAFPSVQDLRAQIDRITRLISSRSWGH